MQAAEENFLDEHFNLSEATIDADDLSKSNTTYVIWVSISQPHISGS